jgi:hypothetical protein
MRTACCARWQRAAAIICRPQWTHCTGRQALTAQICVEKLAECSNYGQKAHSDQNCSGGPAPAAPPRGGAPAAATGTCLSAKGGRLRVGADAAEQQVIP